MMLSNFSRFNASFGVFGFLVVLLLSGCGGDSDPNLGDWTFTKDGITLDKDLQVSETKRYFFGDIQDLDVTSDGRILVLDAEANHLKVLRPDGTLIDTLGRAGRGPGEFQRPTNIAVARGDSVYVFDNQIDRLVVFAPPPSFDVARSVTIPSPKGSATEVQVLDGRLVGRFTPGFTRKEELRRPAPATWRVLDETGASGDTLLLSKRQRLSTSFDGPGVVIARLPFGRVTRATPGPGNRLYHGFTDSLHIQSTALTGTRQTVASVPANPVPIPEAEQDSVLSRIPERLRGEIEAAVPDTKPAFTDLVVADDGRLWVERPTEKAGADKTPWWILDPASKTIHEVQVPSEVDLKVVQNGMAYGTTRTDAGAPALVRYRIEAAS